MLELRLWLPLVVPLLESAYRRRGNGNYVKIKHNNIYSHAISYICSKRKVRRGQYVKQGDIIGWVGMTGNTGWTACLLPFLEVWETSRSLSNKNFLLLNHLKKSLKPKYLEYIAPLKEQLHSITFKEVPSQLIVQN